MKLTEPVDLTPRLSQVAGTYGERAPAAALREHLVCVWTNALDHCGAANLQIVPDGCMDILWTGRELQVAGPDTRAVTQTMPIGATIVGARFRPGIAPKWLRVSAAEVLNARVPLEEFWQRDARDLADQLLQSEPAEAASMLESALLQRLPRVDAPDPALHIIRKVAIRDEEQSVPLIQRLIEELGWSERTLRRRCNEAFGYGPTALAQILRFQRFLHLLRRSSAKLAALALDAGFADQAHLSREVRRLSGLTPGELMMQLNAQLADSFKTASERARQDSPHENAQSLTHRRR
jgi:AraC-like DNA-binding protein